MEVNKQIKITLSDNQFKYMTVPYSCGALWSENFRDTFPEQVEANSRQITELVYEKYKNNWIQWELA